MHSAGPAAPRAWSRVVPCLAIPSAKWADGTFSQPRPAAGDAVLLTDAGFVGEPDLYRVDAEALLARNACQRGGEVFLNVSIAPVAWA